MHNEIGPHKHHLQPDEVELSLDEDNDYKYANSVSTSMVDLVVVQFGIPVRENIPNADDVARGRDRLCNGLAEHQRPLPSFTIIIALDFAYSDREASAKSITVPSSSVSPIRFVHFIAPYVVS
jgi:hypothetical protein